MGGTFIGGILKGYHEDTKDSSDEEHVQRQTNDVVNNGVDIPNEEVEKFEEPNLTTYEIYDDEQPIVDGNRVEK